MKKYIHIYKVLIKLNLVALFEYRANLINSIIGSASWSIFQIVSIFLLTSRTGSVLGWSRDELLIFIAIYNIFVAFFHMLFSGNFERFARIMHYGDFDSVLIKPLDSQFLISFWLINYSTLIRLVIVIPFLIYMIITTGMHVTIFGIFLACVVLLVGIISMYSVWFIITTITIWFTNLSNLTGLLYHVTGFARYPKEIYENFNAVLSFFLLPIILVVSLPTKALLQKNTFPDMFYLFIFSLLLLFISRIFWKFALRYYTSASG